MNISGGLIDRQARSLMQKETFVPEPRRFSLRALALGLLILGSPALIEFAPALSATDKAVTANAGQRRALLIGINKYKVLPRLNGSLNDVAVMRQVLIQRWGFKDANIKMVLDEAGTRAGILKALEQLVRDTGPADTVYIHYSGHGSQVQDLNGDEEDGIDETIVPQDGRTADVPDITDDELDAILTRLRAKHALVVLDSCHSGTATRSIEIQARSVPQDTRVSLYRTGVATRQVVPMTAQRHILMTGAAAHEQALDGPVEGRFHGFFSYSLSKSLRAAGPQVTPREVFSGVEQELKRIQAHFGRASMPEPQLEAPPSLLESPLFGPTQPAGPESSQPTRTTWVETQPQPEGQVKLLHGLLNGAGLGSIWALYPPGDTDFDPSRLLGTATVVQLIGQDALAKVTPATLTIAPKSRAVNILTASVSRVPIRLLDTPADRWTLVEQELQKRVGTVVVVGASEFARFVIETKDDVVRVFGSDGASLVASFSIQDRQWAAGLAHVIARSTAVSELMSLENPGSRIHLEAKVALSPPGRRSRSIAVVADTQPAAYRIRKPGDPRLTENSLQLVVQTDTPGYLTIVDVDSEGHVNILFPNDHQKTDFYANGFIPAGQPVMIPDSLEAGNRAGFFWDYTPPTGEDTIRVFLSTDQGTADMIRARINTAGRSTVGHRDASHHVSSPDMQALLDLRKGFAEVSSRGFILVNEPAMSPTAAVVGSQSGPVAAPAPPPVIPAPSIPGVPPVSASAPVTQDRGDWTATTLSIMVGP